MQHNHPRILFATQDYEYMKEEILEIAHFEKGEIDRKTFPDGERYQKIISNVSGKHVVIIGGTISDAATLELYDLSNALVSFGARSLTLVIPYFSYGTMERSVAHGEVVTAKTRARLFSAIPRASYSNRIFLLDLHSEGLPYYFETGLPANHLYAKPVVADAAINLVGSRDFILASTDSGRAKWVESLANDIGVDGAFVFKKRLDGGKTEITGINANVDGQTVVIYDDMVRTGGSMIKAAKAYKEAGAQAIHVITTHGLFVNNALDKLFDTRVVESVTATNSHPIAMTHKNPKYQVKSVGGVIAKALTWF